MGWIQELTPADIGLPPKFEEWQGDQARAIERIAEDDCPIIAVCAPTGTGKSPIAMAASLLNGGRAAYVTSTNALMDQARADFWSCGLQLIRGKRNYTCSASTQGYSCDEFWKYCKERQCELPAILGPSHKKECTPVDCEAWAGTCPYKQAFQQVMKSGLALTNYAYWCRLARVSSLGKFHTLVLDEAHDAPEELSRSMQIQLTSRDLTLAGRIPKMKAMTEWAKWAEELSKSLSGETMKRQLVELLSPKGKGDPVMAARRVEQFVEKLGDIAQVNGDWTVQGSNNFGWRFDPVWPYAHAKRLLFQGARKVVLMSATLTPKTLALLGVKKGDYSWHSYPYVFPRRNSPTVHVKTVAVSRRNFESDPSKEQAWLKRIVSLMAARTDRKGIVHTVSYEKQNRLMGYIERVDKSLLPYCVTHGSGDTDKAIAEFKHSKTPRCLLSPAVTTGYDFPGEECEYVIIPKLPFPPMQSAVMKERHRLDPQYGAHLMVQALVQSAGRGVRSASDLCEILILDDQWFWVKRRYAHLIPRWFQVRTVNSNPRPPRSLAKTRAYQAEGEL